MNCAALERLRGQWPARAVDAAIASLRAQDGDLNTGQQFSAQEGAQIIYAEQGATIVTGDAPVTMTAVDRQSALGRYLQHLIARTAICNYKGFVLAASGSTSNLTAFKIKQKIRFFPIYAATSPLK
ncbi:MAG: hypothetical protein NTX45_11180 [Proteobacteria bacterium]|nr:hypothetical protein [Pseudomonadota bacterium]